MTCFRSDAGERWRIWRRSRSSAYRGPPSPPAAPRVAYVERRANRFERYAGRFAAKEAGMKAIGTGWKRGVRWQDFEVANLPSGRPTLKLHGEAARIAGQLGVKVISLSITHTAELGMAHVVLEG